MERMKGLAKIGAAGRRAEKGLAARLHGEQTLASGAKAGDKGDVSVKRDAHQFLIEAKSTKFDSISLKLQWLLKIKQEALESCCDPAIAINFTNDHGVLIKDGSWILISEKKFKEMIGD